MFCPECNGMMVRRPHLDLLVEGVLHKFYECAICQITKRETTTDERELKRFLLEEGENGEEVG